MTSTNFVSPIFSGFLTFLHFEMHQNWSFPVLENEQDLFKTGLCNCPVCRGVINVVGPQNDIYVSIYANPLMFVTQFVFATSFKVTLIGAESHTQLAPKLLTNDITVI